MTGLDVCRECGSVEQMEDRVCQVCGVCAECSCDGEEAADGTLVCRECDDGEPEDGAWPGSGMGLDEIRHSQEQARRLK